MALNRLKELIYKRNMSCKEVANLCEVEPPFISDIGNGKARIPSHLVKKLATILQVEDIHILNLCNQAYCEQHSTECEEESIIAPHPSVVAKNTITEPDEIKNRLLEVLKSVDYNNISAAEATHFSFLRGVIEQNNPDKFNEIFTNFTALGTKLVEAGK